MNETTVKSDMAFVGRLLKVEVVDVELPSGSRSVREIVRHPGASVILPELPDGRFLFVRQFRKPLERVMIEAVAGTLDPGETPGQCARRELVEETGHTASRFLELGTIFPAPGYTDEALHLYYATGLEKVSEPRPDEDEKLDVVTLTAEGIDRMIAHGEIGDAKTLCTWLLWKNRPAP